VSVVPVCSQKQQGHSQDLRFQSATYSPISSWQPPALTLLWDVEGGGWTLTNEVQEGEADQ